MANPQNRWSALEHQIYQELLALSVEGRKCLLAVSGGADSMALVQIFARLQPALKLSLAVCYIHHGPTDNSEQAEYRQQALELVQKTAAEKKIDFHTRASTEKLSSEEQMRNFRKKSLQQLKEELGFDYTVWAHHQNDFLETQMLRLIRGGGPESILEPMSKLRSSELRPLLSLSRQEIIDYLLGQNLTWLEDPSNQDETYLRNWLRMSWLPQLEAKCPGALKSLSRSLGLLRESHSLSLPEEVWEKEGINRNIFLTLNVAEKKQVLVLYMRRLGKKEFTQNHISEVLKHLDISQLNHRFQTAQLVWSISRDLISAKSPLVVNATERC